MGDLCQRRLQALPVRMHAGTQLEAAVGCEPRGGLLVTGHHGDAPTGVDGGAVRCLLAVDGETDADESAVRLAAALPCANCSNVDGFDGPAQCFGIIAAVEMLIRYVVERHLVGPDQVSAAHHVRLESGLARDGVEHELEREAHARPRNAAIRQNRAFVGGD